MRFDELKIREEIKRNAKRMGFQRLTEIQKKSVEKIISGRDVVGQAETGSGKTVAFALPILDRIQTGRGIQALILTPTRELCLQISDVFTELSGGLGVSITSVYGGVGIDAQIKKLHNTDIVVGTPGRILDHIGRGTIRLSEVRFLVLDETDRMFDMGFIDDVEEIIRHIPRRRQTLMFSATMHGVLNHIIERHLHDPVFVYTKSHVDHSKLRQVYYEVYDQNMKFSLLVHLLKTNKSGLSLVFCATRSESDIVASNLRSQGLSASAIHGGMSQDKREKSMDSLKSQKTDILVATDVAARGIDVKNVTHVYNYDVPKTSSEYVHRIGRTARAGNEGEAITLLTHKDHDNFRRVLRDPELDVLREEMPYVKKVPFDRGSLRGGYGDRRSGGRPGGRSGGSGYRSGSRPGAGAGRRPSGSGYRSGGRSGSRESRGRPRRGGTSR